MKQLLRLAKASCVAAQHPRYWQKFVIADLVWTQTLYKIIKRITFGYRSQRLAYPVSCAEDPARSLRRYGFAILDPHGIDGEVSALRDLLEKRLNQKDSHNAKGIASFQPKRKEFLQDFKISPHENSNMMRICENQEIVDVISGYLQEQFYLIGSSVWYSPNDNFEGRSQLFHLDHESLSTIKVFIALNDIDETAGPLTILPKEISNKLYKRLRRLSIIRKRNQKVEDRTIEDALGVAITQIAVPLTLKRNQVAIVDTSKCYHYGSRPLPDIKNSERMMINLIYVPWHSPELPFIPTSNGMDLRSITGLVEESFTNRYLR